MNVEIPELTLTTPEVEVPLWALIGGGVFLYLAIGAAAGRLARLLNADDPMACALLWPVMACVLALFPVILCLDRTYAAYRWLVMGAGPEVPQVNKDALASGLRDAFAALSKDVGSLAGKVNDLERRWS